MFEKKIAVNNKTGLHARPASDLAKLCQRYESNIMIKIGTMEINPKSVISILAGGVNQGTVLLLQVEGEDEQQAGEDIVNFMTHLTD
ncbi:HPr family phosphocarrier protein [Anaerocolumna xylanovorans]|uniref:Phosphocarrier protein HPr n=1 Tax=Anaerocolumna xylanovorans DSM 12503 TaxID=1121345 RepID=A0A1M7YDA9_9FIRM|nr:HPr family phosphocarrier protein [Anaerocolumna xylanovorans]SHO50615.1 phosphocarrier protein [Anaerocolumna xylanovorans DSM 12503]